MKKVLFLLLAISALITSLSIAYYFVIVLPKQEQENETRIRKIEEQTNKIQRNTQYSEPTSDSSDIQDQLDEIQSSMQEQERDNQMRADCERSGNLYQGGGVCKII